MLPKGLLKEYSRALSLVLRVMDMTVVFLAGWCAYFFKFAIIALTPDYISALLIATLLTPIVFYFFEIYSSVRGKSFFDYCVSLLQAVAVVSFLLPVIGFITKSGEIYSRAWFGMWMGIALVALILMRCSVLFLLRIMRAHGMNERRVVILGAGELGAKFASAVQQALWTGYRIITLMDDAASDKPQLVHGIPVIQTPQELDKYITEHHIDEIWLALPLGAEERVKQILYQIRHQTVTTRFVLDIFGLDLLNHSVTDIAGFPVLNIRSTPMVGLNRLIKAVEDRVIAFIILLSISPLLALIALGVKLTSKGAVFFKQKRLGCDGRIINVYKFRTMYMHKEVDGVVTQATAMDKRVTPFGRFLRRTSLDELPQFINVLQGTMSIVGPRPHALAHNELYKEVIHTYMQRHRVKPGITGWAQINGWRGETDTLLKMEKRVEYDLYYINNWSLGFDLKIIFLTFFRGFFSRNAY